MHSAHTLCRGWYSLQHTWVIVPKALPVITPSLRVAEYFDRGADDCSREKPEAFVRYGLVAMDCYQGFR